MAEFQKVIEQFKRLCDSANQDCSSCGLGNMSCSMKDIVDNSVEFEKRVMAWAAEHPVIYPTWYEFLTKRYHKAWEAVGCDSIPADIAQKLGITPKENY